MAQNASEDAGTFTVPGTLTLFGYDPQDVEVTLRPRSRAWRMAGAIRAQVVGLILAPMVGLVPPHAPWALGALGGGFFFARKRWMHHFTVEGVKGRCPKCGAPVDPPTAQLRSPHAVSCDGCHHESTLEVDPQALAGLAHHAD